MADKRTSKRGGSAHADHAPAQRADGLREIVGAEVRQFAAFDAVISATSVPATGRSAIVPMPRAKSSRATGMSVAIVALDFVDIPRPCASGDGASAAAQWRRRPLPTPRVGVQHSQASSALSR